MKRSSSVRLTLMGAVAAGGLSACDSGVTQPGNFTTVPSCIEAGNSSQSCVAAQNAAFASHEQKAPRFPSREECLRSVDVNDCVVTNMRNPDGSMARMFVPAMAGFMLAQAMRQGGATGGGGVGGGPFYGSRSYPNQYRDADNLTGSRSVATSSPGAPATIAPSRPPNVQTTTIARSGFGSSSGFHGGSSS